MTKKTRKKIKPTQIEIPSRIKTAMGTLSPNISPQDVISGFKRDMARLQQDGTARISLWLNGQSAEWVGELIPLALEQGIVPQVIFYPHGSRVLYLTPKSLDKTVVVISHSPIGAYSPITMIDAGGEVYFFSKEAPPRQAMQWAMDTLNTLGDYYGWFVLDSYDKEQWAALIAAAHELGLNPIVANSIGIIDDFLKIGRTPDPQKSIKLEQLAVKASVVDKSSLTGVGK